MEWKMRKFQGQPVIERRSKTIKIKREIPIMWS